ncbi:hypothetical protein D3C87_1943170 [compost metagenome]
MVAFAAIQAHPQQAERVHTKADGAIGEAGFVIEQEALRPFCCLALPGGTGAIAVVVVEVVVAKTQGGLAVLDEVSVRHR